MSSFLCKGYKSSCDSSSLRERATANCQTVFIESLDDFCLWAPPKGSSLSSSLPPFRHSLTIRPPLSYFAAGLTIGDTEAYEVAWCTKENRGARIIPKGKSCFSFLVLFFVPSTLFSSLLPAPSLPCALLCSRTRLQVANPLLSLFSTQALLPAPT